MAVNWPKLAASRLGPVICEKCKKVEERRAFKQKFCSECSIFQKRKRARDWQNKGHRESSSKTTQRQRERMTFIQKHGERVSVECAKGKLLFPDRSSAAKFIRIEFPFAGHLSKNAIGNIGMMTGKPFMFVRRDVHRLRDFIAALVMEQLGTFRWPVSKTWIDVVVQKPTNRCDAINVIDTLCDGLKVGLNVDDKWFALGVVDWELVFANPMVFVQVSTMANRNQKNCSTCGQIKYLDEGFREHAQASDRFAGVCKACTTALSRSKNKEMNGSIPNTVIPKASNPS